MKFLVLSALVACVFADGHFPEVELYPGHGGPGMNMDGMGKEPCCLPDHYHFKMAVENGWKDENNNHGMSKAFSENWLDFPGGRMTSKETKWEDGHMMNYTSVADFNKKMMKVYDHQSKQCYWFDIPGTIVGQCFNKDAEYQGTMRVGAGENSIATDFWMAGFMDEEVAMKMELGVTSQGCIPMFSNLEGEMGGLQFKTGGMYFDTRSVIADDMVFDPPAACMDAMKIDTPDAIKAMAFINDKFFPSSNPHKCCFPMAWEGQMNQQTGANIDGAGGAMINVYIPHVAVNYEYLKFAVTEYISYNGVSALNVTYIGDMRYGVMYESNIDTKVCRKFNIPSVNKEMTNNCLPSSAQFLGSTMLGAKDGGLPVSSWRTNYQSNNLNMTIDMATTDMDGTCTPISELVIGMNSDKTSFMSVSSFMNLKAGVENPEVFHPPQSCDGAEIEDLPQEIADTLDVMMRFLNQQ